MKRNIIFVGGIHGVGKGTICEKISQDYKLIHLTASTVLKWEEISTKSNKAVKNFSETQSRLINGLNVLIEEKNTYLLDGHYCMLDSNNNPKRIEKSTFKQISPRVFCVVTNEVEIIFNRLKMRDSVNYSLELLTKMQKMEIEYAIELATEHNKPFVEIHGNNISELVKYL